MYNKKCLMILTVLAALSQTTQAANWLMLQGTERPKATHKFWGFVQPSYTYDSSDTLSGLTFAPLVGNNGKRTAKNSIAPWFDDDSRFHFRRARFGVRGRLSDKINYFTLFEVAPNLLTYDPFGDRARTVALDHLSMTFNYIKGARVRVGLFKTPGPEESFNAIHTMTYIEFTDFVARETLERFVTGAGKPAGSPLSPGLGTPTSVAYGFNGVRDWGIQVFDSFKKGKWDLSYAVMLGRGEGIHETSDTDNNNDVYLYTSAEYDLPGGKGPFKNGIKYYSFYQAGKRSFQSDLSGAEYDRKRYGIGVKAVGRLFGGRYKHRIAAELLYADGMLFLAPAGGVRGGVLQIAAEEGNKARGYTLDYGFFLNRHWEFGIRYHRNNLLYERVATVNPGNERIFKEWTLGINYNFTPRKRLSLNYTIRDIEAPNAYVASGGFTAGAAATLTNDVQRIVGTTDNRIALQFTWVF